MITFKKRLCYFLIITLSVFSTALFAVPPVYYPNGQVLLGNCTQLMNMLDKKGYQEQSANWCVGYMTGIIDFQNYSAALALAKFHQQNPKKPYPSNKDQFKFFCATDQLTVEDAVKVVTHYLQQNKDKLAYPAALLSYTALSQAYPCK